MSCLRINSVLRTDVGVPLEGRRGQRSPIYLTNKPESKALRSAVLFLLHFPSQKCPNVQQFVGEALLNFSLRLM